MLDVLFGKVPWIPHVREFALVFIVFSFRKCAIQFRLINLLIFLIQNKSEINDFDNRQIYCIKGCNEASNFYFQWIKQEVQSPMAPALIPDSLTSTSLSLEWSVPSKFSELAKGNLFKKTKNETYFVQCYEDYEDDWKLCGKQTIYENSTIRLENIHPYTKYKVSDNDVSALNERNV